MALTRSARYLFGYCGHIKYVSNIAFGRSFTFAFYGDARTLATFTAANSKRTESSELHDSSKVTVIGLQNERSEMTYSDLKIMASEQKKEKGRDLIRAFVGGKEEEYPTFKILSPGELETAVRKARQYKTKVIYEKVSDENQTSARIREKQIIVNVNIGDHDLDIAVKRIQNWLKKSFFVNMTVKKSGSGQKETDNLIENIKERCKEELASRKDCLRITIK